MRGEVVVVKDVSGKALIRRVWSSDALAVYITDDKGFARMTAGDQDAVPVGFPREAVFAYEAGAESAMADGRAWDTLRPWGRVK